VLRISAPAAPADDLRERLDVAAARGALVLVDDAHRLDADTLRLLAASARAGLPMVVARRPTVGSADLADLDEAVAAAGRVEVLAPLDATQVGALVTTATGRPCPTATATAVCAASGGLPAVVAALATALAAGPGVPGGSGELPAAPALAARLQRRLAVVPAAHVHLARVLALGLDLTDDVLAAACGLDLADLTVALQSLRDMGLLAPGGERMVPAVADTLLSELPAGSRRRLHEDVARALAGSGAPAPQAAAHLRSARARGPEAAAAFLAAAEHLRFTDPGAALGWYDDAREAGAAVVDVAAGAAEAGALLGLAVDTDLPSGVPPTPVAGRLALVAGAVAAAQGRPGPAADALLAAPDPGPVLAVPALVAVGRLDAARTAALAPAPGALHLLAAAALAAPDPGEALPAAIDAAGAAERTPPHVVLPDTPHALGAVLAVAAGDVGTAVELLERAVRYGVGGPAAQDRHGLLLAWARLRAGRRDPATTPSGGGDADVAAEPNGRDRVLRAAVAAGWARRSGDVARLRAAWPEAERVLARGGLDLLLLEPAEELVVAAARLRRLHRADPALAGLESAVAGLGSPPAWEVTLGWLHLQVAVAGDDAGAAAAAAARVVGAGPGGHRQRAQQQAAPCWADALAGRVDADAVVAAADALAAAELPWEASRLAGDAAIRVPDATAARRLLERARDLAGELAAPVPVAVTGAAPSRDAARQAGLSDREVEVAQLVLDGRTHREIGAQLYLSPKTVEHHVARIRTKLGASTRAEFVAALRGLIGGGISPP